MAVSKTRSLTRTVSSTLAALAVGGVVWTGAAAANELSCRRLAVQDADTGEELRGIEDIAYNRQTHTIYLSAYDRWEVEAAIRRKRDRVPEGAIYTLKSGELKQGAPVAEAPVFINSVTIDGPFRPHGIDFFKNDFDRQTLAVLNRVYIRADDGKSWTRSTRYEEYQINGDSARRVGALRDDRLCAANDVVGMGVYSAIVTLDRKACDWTSSIEDAFNQARGSIVRIDNDPLNGIHMDPAVGRLRFPNGVAVDRGRNLAVVAATRDRALLVYDLEDLMTKEDVEPVKRIAVPGGPDNLSWRRNGELLVALHPELTKTGFYRRRWFGAKKAPSRIASVNIRKGDVEVLFDDPTGDIFSAATVAVEAEGRLIMGGAVEEGLLVCARGDGAAS